MFRSHNSDFMFVANVMYCFEISGRNLKKKREKRGKEREREEMYLGTDYTDFTVFSVVIIIKQQC